MTVGAAAVSPRRTRRHRPLHLIPFFLFTGPMLVGLGIFTFLPIIWGFLLSFSYARGSVALGNWIGAQNYLQLFHDAEFRDSLVTSVFFMIFIVPVTFAIALGLALLVNEAKAGRAFFRTVFFIPFAVSYVVASLIWKMGLFTVPSGAVVQFLALFGVAPTSFVSTPHPPLYWIVLVTVRLWLQLGFYMVIFLVGIQEIPDTLYEAARVDGARRWSTFWRITMPMLRNTSIAIVILLLIAAFQGFDEFYNIMGGTLNGGNQTLAYMPLEFLYGAALGQQNYGLGTAGAFLLTAMIVIVTIIQGRVFGFGRSTD